MDKIWDRKSFEVGGHWPLWRGWKNWMTTQSWQKSNAKKKKGILSQILSITFFSYLNSSERASNVEPFNVECQTRELLVPFLLRCCYDAVLDWGLNPGPPAFEASTLLLIYVSRTLQPFSFWQYIFVCFLYNGCNFKVWMNGLV